MLEVLMLGFKSHAPQIDQRPLRVAQQRSSDAVQEPFGTGGQISSNKEASSLRTCAGSMLALH